MLCLRNHAINEYKLYCSKVDYDCLSSSTLTRILNSIKPKTRRRLGGVDSFLVHGYNAIDNLLEIVELIPEEEQKKKLKICFDEISTYLKVRYENNCELDSDCISHCVKHALSSAMDSSLNLECEKQHNKICHDCSNIVNSVNMLKQEISKIPSPDKNYQIYQIDNYHKDIMAWQKHLIRSHQQEKAKCYALQHVDGKTAFWVRDWAQKILPGAGMEAQDVITLLIDK